LVTINAIKEISQFQPQQLERIIDFANAAGALATTQKGAIPAMPSLAEVEQCMKQVRKYKLNAPHEA
jgi:fructokinase